MAASASATDIGIHNNSSLKQSQPEPSTPTATAATISNSNQDAADVLSRPTPPDAVNVISIPSYSRREEEGDDAGKKKGKASMDIYGANMIQSGLFVQTKNPYFVTKIRPNRLQELYVPVDVVRDFELTLAERVVLRDPAGRDWPAYLRTWKDGRTFYRGRRMEETVHGEFDR